MPLSFNCTPSDVSFFSFSFDPKVRVKIQDAVYNIHPTYSFHLNRRLHCHAVFLDDIVIIAIHPPVIRSLLQAQWAYIHFVQLIHMIL